MSFSEKQIGCLVRAVSEETSIVSFRMMTDLLEKAAGLKPVLERKPKPSDSFRIKRASSTRGSGVSSLPTEDSASDGYSSGGATTEDGLGSLEFHRQKEVTSDCDLIEASLITLQSPKSPGGSTDRPA